MVTFFLYDDTPTKAAFADMLQASANKYGIECKVITFTYRNSMLNHIRKNPQKADIILMTADGRNFDSLRIAGKARELGSRASFIIYGRGRHGAGKYKEAGQYLPAPVGKEQFEEALLKAVQEQNERSQNSLEVKVRKMPEKLPISEIRYLAVNNRIVDAHMGEEVYRFYSSLEELSGTLEGCGFVRLHRGYLVNRRYVKESKSSHVLLEDGTRIPVGRNYRKNLRHMRAASEN